MKAGIVAVFIALCLLLMTRIAIAVGDGRGQHGHASSGALAIVASLFIALAGATVLAQSYPAKPVRLVVPSGPGGSPDILGRLVAQKLSEGLGQQVVVENRPGAGGSIGMETVAKSTADGYTLGLTTTSALSVAPTLYSNLGYDPVASFEAISLLTPGKGLRGATAAEMGRREPGEAVGRAWAVMVELDDETRMFLRRVGRAVAVGAGIAAVDRIRDFLEKTAEKS